QMPIACGPAPAPTWSQPGLRALIVEPHAARGTALLDTLSGWDMTCTVADTLDWACAILDRLAIDVLIVNAGLYAASRSYMREVMHGLAERQGLIPIVPRPVLEGAGELVRPLGPVVHCPLPLRLDRLSEAIGAALRGDGDGVPPDRAAAFGSGDDRAERDRADDGEGAAPGDADDESADAAAPTVVRVSADIEDLIPLFMEHRQRDLDQLPALLAAGDFDSVRRIGHNMKGSGAAYGLDHISTLGARLERCAAAGDRAGVERLGAELRGYFDRVQFEFCDM
ncbi:MAG: Hpt domain-containing protein, partial [Myxococcota bacterium]